MNIKRNLLAVIALGALVSCGNPAADSTEENVTDSTNTESSMEESVDTTAVENPEGFYGKIIDEEGITSLEDFNAKMAESDSLNIKIAAVASAVCKKKGCWMKVETANGEEMRVTFKDYGFFVPLDIEGKEVVFEGIAVRDTTTVDDLRHYAEDGGATEEEIAAITEPEIKVSFIADGVILRD